MSRLHWKMRPYLSVVNHLTFVIQIRAPSVSRVQRSQTRRAANDPVADIDGARHRRTMDETHRKRLKKVVDAKPVLEKAE
jgi:hypothetical protein